MIKVYFATQSVGCDICGEQTEVRAKQFYDQEHMTIRREQLAEDHKECEQYKHDPRLAKLQRGFTVSARRESKRRVARETVLARTRR